MRVLLLALLAIGISLVRSEDEAQVEARDDDIPSWATDSSMLLEFAIGEASTDWDPRQFTIIPLTENSGLNSSASGREVGFCRLVLGRAG